MKKDNKPTIPNCAICMWMKEVLFAIIGNRMVCRAFGGTICENENGSERCKKLFREKE